MPPRGGQRLSSLGMFHGTVTGADDAIHDCCEDGNVTQIMSRGPELLQY